MNTKGEYFRPGSSAEHTKDWQDASKDEFQDFLDNVADGEVESEKEPLRLGSEFRIERKSLYEIYKSWSESVGDKYGTLTRNKFYRKMKGHKFEPIKSDGVFYIKGIGFSSKLNQPF